MDLPGLNPNISYLSAIPLVCLPQRCKKQTCERVANHYLNVRYYTIVVEYKKKDTIFKISTVKQSASHEYRRPGLCLIHGLYYLYAILIPCCILHHSLFNSKCMGTLESKFMGPFHFDNSKGRCEEIIKNAISHRPLQGQHQVLRSVFEWQWNHTWERMLWGMANVMSHSRNKNLYSFKPSVL